MKREKSRESAGPPFEDREDRVDVPAPAPELAAPDERPTLELHRPMGRVVDELAAPELAQVGAIAGPPPADAIRLAEERAQWYRTNGDGARATALAAFAQELRGRR